MDEVAIKVDHVSKTFRLPHERAGSVKNILVNFARRKKGYEVQQVLNDISFEIKKGEFFGIVGRNGSGKSTLLKLLAGIYTPTKGTVQVNGKLTPFIELGVGFNPDLTGRENVFLNGALLGFSRKEMEAMYDDIVEFAELERFMDQKLKNYSSGMQVRLAFSIAIRANTDILVLDEVLAVGDEAFQRKCTEYFYELKKQKKTVVLVSHSMEAVRSFCDKGMLVDGGEISALGNPNRIAGQYSEIFQKEYIEQKQQEAVTPKEKQQQGDVSVISVDTLQDNKKTKVIDFRKAFSVKCNVSSDKDYDDLVMGVHLVNQSGQTIVAISTKSSQEKMKLHKGKNIYRFDIQNVFAEGNYFIDVAIKRRVTGDFLVQESEISAFSVIGIDTAVYNPSSLVYPDVKMSVEE